MKIISRGNNKDDSDRLDSNDGGEYFVEIEACNLRKSSNYNPCFVFFEEVFGVSFDFEHPFERNCPFVER